MFGRPFGGVLVWLLPAAWLVAVDAWWFPGGRSTQALFDDWVAHAQYAPAFLFGFALAGSPAALAAMRRSCPVALAVAVASYAVVAAIELRSPGGTSRRS